MIDAPSANVSLNLWVITFSFVRTQFLKFELHFFALSKEFYLLSSQDLVLGIITSSCPLLNYLLLIAKIYRWSSRRTQLTLSNIVACEVEKYIYRDKNQEIKWIWQEMKAIRVTIHSLCNIHRSLLFVVMFLVMVNPYLLLLCCNVLYWIRL